MYLRNVSGQVVYFGLFNISSGLPITSGAGGISGNRSIDAGVQSLVGGAFAETGNGQYFWQGTSSDFNGNVIGLLFTASGAAPVSINLTTGDNIWKVDMSGIQPTSGLRTPIQGIRKLVNRIDTAFLSGKLAVFQEDDTTLAYAENIGSIAVQSGSAVTSLKPS